MIGRFGIGVFVGGDYGGVHFHDVGKVASIAVGAVSCGGEVAADVEFGLG